MDDCVFGYILMIRAVSYVFAKNRNKKRKTAADVDSDICRYICSAAPYSAIVGYIPCAPCLYTSWELFRFVVSLWNMYPLYLL